MPLQRTRALAFARVRSLPSVTRRSPLNARPLGAFRSTPRVRLVVLALLLLFAAADARSGGDCGFPWTIAASPAGGERLAIFLCGGVCGCFPHNRQVSVVGSEIRVTYTQGEAPDGCSCLTVCYDFQDTVIVGLLSPGEYSLMVTLVDCNIPTLVATGTVRLDPSATIPTLDRHGAIALALLLALAAAWRLRN
jgi:hypothetical protein